MARSQRLVLIVSVLLAFLALVGVGMLIYPSVRDAFVQHERTTQLWRDRIFPLSDGRIVTCVETDWHAVSCDWEHAK